MTQVTDNFLLLIFFFLANILVAPIPVVVLLGGALFTSRRRIPVLIIVSGLKIVTKITNLQFKLLINLFALVGQLVVLLSFPCATPIFEL